MEYPMNAALKVGAKFPNFELPDHTGAINRLTHHLHGFPGVLIFSRGHFCPKDRRYMSNYVQYLQPELRVNYCHLVTVSVDDALTTYEMREQLNADWTFLCDNERKLLHELEMVDSSDPIHGSDHL
ncbi:MAG: redoxin domain-containing protein [Anaerolineae bacterium]|nr:redoxin domain-containing protein [Anaerolineae bacterium]